jgi:hypothetical protein
MKHLPKILTLSVLCMLLAGLGLAQTLQDAAKLLPAETVALIQTKNFSQLLEQLKKTDYYALYKDPEITPFIKNVAAKIDEKLEEVENESFKAMVEQKVLPQGCAAIGIILNDRALKDEPLVLMAFDWGDNLDKIKKIAEGADKESIEDGDHISKTTFQAVQIVTHASYVTNAEGSQETDQWAYCFLDQVMLASDDVEVLKFAIAHLKGASSSTLADSADYNAALAATGPHHDIDIYVNIRQIVKSIADKDDSGKAKAMIEKLGFDNVTSAALSVGVARQPGTTSLQKMWLKVDGTKKGIIKMLELDPQAVKAPPFLSSSVYSVMFLNVSIRSIVEQLGMIWPMPVASLYTPLPSPDGGGTPGPQIKADLIDHLGSQILIAQSINKSAPHDDFMPVDTLFAVAVKNRAAVDKTLSFLHRTFLAAGQQDSTRELLGHTIYLVSASFLPTFFGQPTSSLQDAGPAQPQVPKAALTVTDTHLLIASQTNVENAIRMLSEGRSESLSSTAWFNAAKTDMPSLVGAATLQDNAAAIELLWNRARKPDSSSKSAAMDPFGLFTNLFKGIDFSLVPEFDKVRKYFGTSSGYGLSKPDGFYFESRN